MRVQITRVDGEDVLIFPDDLAASLGFDRARFAEMTVLSDGSLSVRPIKSDDQEGSNAAGDQSPPSS